MVMLNESTLQSDLSTHRLCASLLKYYINISKYEYCKYEYCLNTNKYEYHKYENCLNTNKYEYHKYEYCLNISY